MKLETVAKPIRDPFQSVYGGIIHRIYRMRGAGNVQEYQNPVKSLAVKRFVKLITIDAQRSAALRVVSPVP